MRSVEIGTATLYHGHCGELLPFMDLSHAIVSDPPYGTGMQFGSKAKTAKQRDGNLWGQNWGEMQGDDIQFDPAPYLAFKECILWGAHWYCDKLPPGRRWLLWQKGVPEDWSGSAHELAWTHHKGGGIWSKQLLWHGFRRETEVREHYHPTQKPVALMQWCIEMTQAPTVIDPYMGSGTTGVAALTLGRNFIGVEFEQRYFDVACERIRVANLQGRLFA